MNVKKAWPWFLGGWLLLALATAWLFFSGGSYRKLEPFPVESYLTAPGNLRGNSYRLEGQVQSFLGWEEGAGRLLAVTPVHGGARVAVFVAGDDGGEIHIGQRYRMRVTVASDGLIRVQSMSKY